jgi:GT2 family glycosyltransferase
MPVHNGGRYLAEAVDSIRSQTFDDFELVIVDDGSTDGTAEFLDRVSAMDKRIRVYTQERSGLVATLNHACDQARGALLARMDADDIAAPHRLAAQVARMHANPDLGLLGGNVTVIREDGQRIHDVRYPPSDVEVRALLPKSSAFAHPTVMMRRSAFEQIGGYRPAFVDAEDYDLWLRFAEHYQLANLPTSILRYRLHPGQVSSRRRQQQIISTAAAQVAAALRSEGYGDRPIAGFAPVTLDHLRAVRSLGEIAELISAAAASRALFLASAGDPFGALELLDWAADTGGGARLSRRHRAQLALARATAALQTDRYAGGLGSALQLIGADPVYAFDMFRKAVATGHAGLPLARFRRALPCAG